MQKPLVVLVHGLSASTDWWGATVPCFTSHPRLTHLEIATWGYHTHRQPQTFFHWIIHRRNLQGIKQLGAHLLTFLKDNGARRTQLVLLGHSLGGLVIAAALVEAERQRLTDLIGKIRSVMFCATPLAGARFAKRIAPLLRRIGANVQVADLTARSRDRGSKSTPRSL